MKNILIALLLSSAAFALSQDNPVASRLQWMHNQGYCGETSLITAALFYGQYLSQYDVRALATKDHSQTAGQLLLGVNDVHVARQMRLQYEAWDTDSEQSTDSFLCWVKQNIGQGYPLTLGVYANQSLFYNNPNPKAGDPDYDHIVTAISINSSHPLTDPSYYGDDKLTFSDHGLWQKAYYFTYAFEPFQASREQANDLNGAVYSLANEGSNYGLAITGIVDRDGDTLPVRIDVNCNYENPAIAPQSNTRPDPMALTLTVTLSNLTPGTPYILYRYNTLESIPDSHFNTQASQAFERWPVAIDSGTTYIHTQQIQSDEIACYRCVKATAP